MKSAWTNLLTGISIYIPLWSYSNGVTKQVAGLAIKFTFHYGPIQMLHHLVLLYYNHYLHSTMVLFKFEYPALIRKTHTHLHSTMVLFKWNK